MYCRKCGHEIPKGSTFCSKCGTSIDPKRDKEKLRQKQAKQQEKEKKRVKEKRKEYENNPAVIGFAFVLFSFIMVVAPTGRETQLQWWYLAGVIASAVAGLYFSYRGKKIDDALDRKFRVRVHPKLITTSYILSSLVIIMWLVVVVQVMMGILK